MKIAEILISELLKQVKELANSDLSIVIIKYAGIMLRNELQCSEVFSYVTQILQYIKTLSFSVDNDSEQNPSTMSLISAIYLVPIFKSAGNLKIDAEIVRILHQNPTAPKTAGYLCYKYYRHLVLDDTAAASQGERSVG